ncbi:M20 metallopeptidase family protein [Anaeroselena agilis]|uniref:Amidohydrolase n=1 Tax=Anaeroselena agilis TaxID=3063788 RepID=A0ABU3P4H5_9FIRM|nr:amidohydrolase [Selenomonadales bacterium 4137-cl]
MQNKIKALAAQNHPAVVALRRHFRAHPELGGREFATQAKIVETLSALGLAPVPVAGTGVIADIKGAAGGKTVALRADIDALPLTDECGQPYASTVDGVCHACGHDGHTAALLGVAMALAALRDGISGTVRLIFQPSEEILPGGSLGMIEGGALAGVDCIIGAHLWPTAPLGKLHISRGRLMASADAFRIAVHGKGGHGSMPHRAVNPILIGTEIVAAVNAIVGCNIDPLEPVVLSVGSFQSGEAENIIPDKASIKGTLRCFDGQLRYTVLDRIETICRHIGAANDAEVTVEKVIGYPPLINHPAVAERVIAAGREALGADGVEEIPPALASEDFAHYLAKVPGAFMFIGAAASGRETYPLHHPRFDFDERALTVAVETLAGAALGLLRP